MKLTQKLPLTFLLVVLTSIMVLARSTIEIWATPAENYVFNRSWGSDGTQLSLPSGIAVSADGRLYITNDYLHRLTIISANERVVVNVDEHGFYYPRAVVLDAAGNVYVADS